MTINNADSGVVLGRTQATLDAHPPSLLSHPRLTDLPLSIPSLIQVSWFNQLGAAPPVSYDIIVDQVHRPLTPYSLTCPLTLLLTHSLPHIYSLPHPPTLLRFYPPISTYRGDWSSSISHLAHACVYV